MPRFLTKAPDFSLTRLSLPAAFPMGDPLPQKSETLGAFLMPGRHK